MNAIILYSYATLSSIDDVGDFYRHLMRSHATDEVIAQGKSQYQMIGTCDPLSSSIKRLGRMLVKRLEKDTEEAWQFYIGNKHTTPFVKDAVKSAVGDGAEKIVTIPTTPFYTKTGTELYNIQTRRSLAYYGADIPQINVVNYYREQAFIDMMTERLVDAYKWLSSEVKQGAEVMFTCHSMPGSVEKNQEFIQQYEFLAEKLMKSLPERTAYTIAYRSAGPNQQEWLQPDILDMMKERAEKGATAFVACELLSIIANAEVIQEVGIDAPKLANQLGVGFVQTEYINDHFDFVDFLVEQVKRELD